MIIRVEKLWVSPSESIYSFILGSRYESRIMKAFRLHYTTQSETIPSFFDAERVELSYSFVAVSKTSS